MSLLAFIRQSKSKKLKDLQMYNLSPFTQHEDINPLKLLINTIRQHNSSYQHSIRNSKLKHQTKVVHLDKSSNEKNTPTFFKFKVNQKISFIAFCNDNQSLINFNFCDNSFLCLYNLQLFLASMFIKHTYTQQLCTDIMNTLGQITQQSQEDLCTYTQHLNMG